MKKGTIIILLFGLSGVGRLSAQHCTIPLWPGDAPGTENRENREYWRDSTIVYQVYQPALTVFPGDGEGAPVAAVIVLPGGGYRQLEMGKEGCKVARWLNECGIASFVLKYRLDPNEALQDVGQAMRLLRSRADEFHIDPDKIGVIGFSAGAHLAGNLATHYQGEDEEISLRPDFWVGIYGSYRPRGADRQDNFNSFSDLIDEDSPPVMIIHAGDDSRVPVQNSVEMYMAYQQKGVPAELHIYERGNHGFALETNRGVAITSTVKSWSARFIEWLKVREVLGWE